jgi:hypothetical protein
VLIKSRPATVILKIVAILGNVWMVQEYSLLVKIKPMPWRSQRNDDGMPRHLRASVRAGQAVV